MPNPPLALVKPSSTSAGGGWYAGIGDAVRGGGAAALDFAVAAATRAFMASIFARAASAGDCVDGPEVEATGAGLPDLFMFDRRSRTAAARAFAAAIWSAMLMGAAPFVLEIGAGDPAAERDLLLSFCRIPSLVYGRFSAMIKMCWLVFVTL